MWSCVFTGEEKEEGDHGSACSTTMEREVPRGEIIKKTGASRVWGSMRARGKMILDVLLLYLW